MNSRKILIVSKSFYPVISARSLRTTELAKEFARQGHKVTVITPKKDEVHAAFEKKHGIEIKNLGHQKLKPVKVKGKGITRLFRRALARFPKLLFEYPDIEFMKMVKKALSNEKDYDLMISIAVPHPVHWGVAWCRNENHKIADIWVADCGDPYFGMENDSFRVPFYFKYVEKWAFRKTDYISIPFEGARSAYFSEFHPKIRIIPQGFTIPNFRTGKTSTNGKTDRKVTFAYAGNIASYLHYAIPFLKKLNTIDIPFNFLVYTRRKDIFESYLNKETLLKCDLRDYVSREELFHALSHTDFLVHFPYENESQRSLKLVDYAFMKKPVLSFKNDTNSHIALEEFMDFNFRKKLVIENPDKYRIENVCNQFLNLCLTSSASPPSL